MINAGALTPQEVANSRFGGAEYGTEIQLNTEVRGLLSDNPPEVQGQWA